MDDSPTVPTLPELLASLPADPAPRWPPVPATPTAPGPPWQARTTEGTGLPVWVQPAPPGSGAGALWWQHRVRHEQTGLWPVLVDDAFWEAVELEPYEGTAAFGDARSLLQQLVGEDAADGHADDEAVPRGPVPEVVADDRSPEQVVDASEGHTTLLLVPARAGWLVPEVLAWDGAVNHLAHGREHTAVLGRWTGLYGAELFGLGRDVLQLVVGRPPGDDPTRLAAAAEIYAYCPDAVEQGVETLENLTAMAGSRHWWLWWD